MAKLNYYQFPEHMNAQDRFKAGAMEIEGYCKIGGTSCRTCPNNPHPNTSFAAWRECANYTCTDSEFELSGITITQAKQFLKNYGGSAYTRHIDRSGGCFEVTEITLKGNNSRHKYNRHL